MFAQLHDLVQRYTLTPSQVYGLWRIASQPPAHWLTYLRRVLQLLAALLLGAGLIFWVAAHWPEQSRSFKLNLLQAAVLLPGVLALLLPRLRTALLLLALLAFGGLLAFVGQTYQTGADAWQLFAAWAALSFFWLLLARSDGLWSVWLVIAGTGLALWSGEALLNPLGDLFRRAPHHVLLLACWIPLLLWPWLLPYLRGCAVHSVRSSRLVAALLALSVWTGEGLWGVFTEAGLGLYATACALVMLTLLLAWRQRAQAVLALALLAANVLFLGGCARLLFSDGGSDLVAAFYSMALLAAMSIGFSVRWLHRLHKEKQ